MRISRDVVRHNLNVLGKIHTGEKNDKGYPTSLDYFKATGDYAHLFHDLYGEKPTSISIRFFTDEDSVSCDERYELRVGTKIFAKGDGQLFTIWSDKTKEYVVKTKAELPEIMSIALTAAQKHDPKAQWKERLSLRFILPELPSVFGCWQYDTGGKESSIPQIVGAYDQVKQMAGTVAGINFDLIVKKVTSQKMESKNSFPVVTLIAKSGSAGLKDIKMVEDNKRLMIGESHD